MIRAATARAFYDERFREGNQSELVASGYDACVLAALPGALDRVEAGSGTPVRVLGYGCGQPARLWRLRSRDADRLLRFWGFVPVAVRWWGHLLTALADDLPGVRSLGLAARSRLALLDWRLPRRAPNGAAMLVVARRPEDPR